MYFSGSQGRFLFGDEMKRFKSINELTAEEKAIVREKWKKDWAKYRERHPEKYKERMREAHQNLFERHGVKNMWEYKVKMYSSPDFKPNKRQKAIIEKLVQFTLYSNGAQTSKDLKEYGITREQAALYDKTVYYKERLLEERAKLLEKGLEAIHQYVWRNHDAKSKPNKNGRSKSK